MGSHPYAEDARAHTRSQVRTQMQTTTPLSAWNLRAFDGLERELGDGFGDLKERRVTFLNHPFVSLRRQHSDYTQHQTKLGGIITAVSAQMCNETCPSCGS